MSNEFSVSNSGILKLPTQYLLTSARGRSSGGNDIACVTDKWRNSWINNIDASKIYFGTHAYRDTRADVRQKCM